MQWSTLAQYAAATLILGIFIRVVLLCTILRPPIKKRRNVNEKCKIAIFLGSGGHTSEMMQLIKTLPTDRYNSRTYILTTSDRFSMEKALDYEKSISNSSNEKTSSSSTFDFILIPRARSVHQKWLSTPLSVCIAFVICTYHLVLRPKSQSEAILMNGPGTCVPIVAAVYILRFFGLSSPRLIYVESFARVSSFSLTAKILRPFVDLFVVQWTDSISDGTSYLGFLV